MELKEFIKETVSAIVQANEELAAEHQPKGVVLSPPITGTERDIYDPNSELAPFRRVNIVEFDVAVTATKETAGGGKAGLKIFSAEAGVDGQHSSRNEAVSRVKFTVPIALGESTAEAANQARHQSHVALRQSVAKSDFDPFER